MGVNATKANPLASVVKGDQKKCKLGCQLEFRRIEEDCIAGSLLHHPVSVGRRQGWPGHRWVPPPSGSDPHRAHEEGWGVRQPLGPDEISGSRDSRLGSYLCTAS